MEEKFEWYQILDRNSDITQGDIFINFPFVRVKNYNDLITHENIEDIELDVYIEYLDCIVLTQACDIANEKPDLENIILCPIYDLNVVDFNKQKLSDCICGRMPQFYMLNRCDDFKCNDKEDGFNFHIVNFNIIEKAPISVLKKFASETSARLRLLPPYREHLSQAFAKYFMRIGLPSDINRNVVYKAKGF